MSNPRAGDGSDLVCANCGAELRAGFQFCPECGQPVAATSRPQEPAPTVLDTSESGDWLLAILNGPAQGGAYPVGGKLVLGREESCDVVFPDPKVSRRHAAIERIDEGRFSLVDLDSSNGTFFREERVDRVELIPGAEIRIGDTRMTLVPSFESCPKCGSPLDPSNKYCGNCGHPVGEPAEIDLDQLAANIEAQPRAKAVQSDVVEPVPAAGPAASSSVAPGGAASAPAAKSAAGGGSVGRWLAIGCGAVVLLTASVVCCGFLYPFLEGL